MILHLFTIGRYKRNRRYIKSGSWFARNVRCNVTFRDVTKIWLANPLPEPIGEVPPLRILYWSGFTEAKICGV
jgi:hypothetical protein